MVLIKSLMAKGNVRIDSTSQRPYFCLPSIISPSAFLLHVVICLSAYTTTSEDNDVNIFFRYLVSQARVTSFRMCCLGIDAKVLLEQFLDC